MVLVDQGVVSVTNFLTTVMLGRTSEFELGVYQLGFSVVLFATCAQAALIAAPFAVFTHRFQGRRRRQYAGSALLQQITLAAIATLALLAVGLAASLGLLSPDWHSLPWILAAIVPLVLMREFIRRVAFANLQIRTALVLDVATSALQLAGLFALMQTGWLTSARALAVVGFSGGFVGLAVLYSLRENFSAPRENVLADWRENWNFGRWLFLTQFLLLASIYSVPWMLALSFGGPQAVGQFAACVSIVMMANPLVIGLNNYLGPRAIVAYQHEGLAALVLLAGRSSLLLTAAVGSLAAMLFFGGETLLAAIFGPKLSGNGGIVAVMLIGMLGPAISAGAENGLVALGRPHLLCWAYALGLVAAVTSGALLIFPYGVLGAAWVFSLSAMVLSWSIVALFVWAVRLQRREGHSAQS